MFAVFLAHTEFKKKYGIDPNIDKREQSENLRLYNFELAKDKRLPFGNNFFDVVVMLAVFEHIDPNELCGVLREIYRILKIGCRFILTTPTPFGDKLLKLMSMVNLVSKKEIDDHKGSYAHEDILAYLIAAGFEKIKLSSVILNFF